MKTSATFLRTSRAVRAWILVLGLSSISRVGHAQFATIDTAPATPSVVTTPQSADKPRLGIYTRDVVSITNVVPGSAAEKSGLMAGDILAKINGEKVNDTTAFANLIQDAAAGKPLALLLFRAEHPLVASAGPLPLDAVAATSNQVPSLTNGPKRHLGVAVKTGVIVTYIAPGSAAERAGLQTFDVIAKINNIDTPDTASLHYAVQGLPANQPLRLVVIRAAKMIVVPVPSLTVPDAREANANTPHEQQPVPYERINSDIQPSEELFKRLLRREEETASLGYPLQPHKRTVAFQNFKVGKPLSNIYTNSSGQAFRRNGGAADDAPLYPCSAHIIISEDYGEGQIYQYDQECEFLACVGVHLSNAKGDWFISGEGTS